MNLSLSFQLFFLITLGVAVMPVNIPPNDTNVYGYADESYITNPDDSIIDLSDLVKYGVQTTWNYYNPTDTLLIEQRENCWKAYNLRQDSISLCHSENQTEQSNFLIAYPNQDSIIPIQPYKGRTRRQMTFCYLDSGYTEQREIVTPVLICNENDTIKNCRGWQITTSFDRISEDPGSPSIKIVEKETIWRSPDRFIPYAMSYLRVLTVDDNEPDSICTTAVFPGSFNEGVITGNEVGNQRVKEQGPHDNTLLPSSSAVIGDLTLSSDNNGIVVDGMGDFTLAIYDTAGIKWVEETHLSAPLRYELSHLPQGEYVVTIFHSEKANSITIILRP